MAAWCCRRYHSKLDNAIRGRPLFPIMGYLSHLESCKEARKRAFFHWDPCVAECPSQSLSNKERKHRMLLLLTCIC